MRIDAEALRHAYPGGGDVVRIARLGIAPGERVALLGRNGAGKTTLAKLLCGVLVPTAGRVLLDGQDLAAMPVRERARRIGFVFQDPSTQLFAATVREEVAFGPRNLGKTGPELDTTVRRALERTGLADMAEQNPLDLPHTWRRMTSLASVLAMNCRALALDEPTAGLDAPRVALLEAILADLASDGVTTIAISHEMDFCARNADRLVVLRAGAVVEDRAAAQLFADAPRLDELGLAQPALTALGQDLRFPRPALDEGGFLEQLREASRKHR